MNPGTGFAFSAALTGLSAVQRQRQAGSGLRVHGFETECYCSFCSETRRQMRPISRKLVGQHATSWLLSIAHRKQTGGIL